MTANANDLPMVVVDEKKAERLAILLESSWWGSDKHVAVEIMGILRAYPRALAEIERLRAQVKALEKERDDLLTNAIFPKAP